MFQTLTILHEALTMTGNDTGLLSEGGSAKGRGTRMSF